MIRGGGWNSEPNELRATHRQSEDATIRQSNIGFRLKKGIVVPP